MTNFERTVVIGTCDGYSLTHKEMRLATRNAALYLDFYLTKDGQMTTGTMSAPGAKALRDALLEAYPLAQPAQYDSKNPKVGDVVEYVPGQEYGFVHIAMPATIAAVNNGPHQLVSVDLTAANGERHDGCFAYRFRAYNAPTITKADVLAAAEQARAEGFAAGKAQQREEDEAARKVKEPKWEQVADGLSRIKVDGGFIYENLKGEIEFVRDYTETTLCAFTGPCVYKKG